MRYTFSRSNGKSTNSTAGEYYYYFVVGEFKFRYIFLILNRTEIDTFFVTAFHTKSNTMISTKSNPKCWITKETCVIWRKKGKMF